MLTEGRVYHVWGGRIIQVGSLPGGHQIKGKKSIYRKTERKKIRGGDQAGTDPTVFLG